MKVFKALPANVFIVLTLTVFLTLLSLPAWAEEEIQAPEAVEDVAAEPAAVPVSEEAAAAEAAAAVRPQSPCRRSPPVRSQREFPSSFPRAGWVWPRT